MSRDPLRALLPEGLDAILNHALVKSKPRRHSRTSVAAMWGLPHGDHSRGFLITMRAHGPNRLPLAIKILMEPVREGIADGQNTTCF